MFPKKGSVWTNRERGRVAALIMGIVAIGFWIALVTIAVRTSDWSKIYVPISVTVCVVAFIISNERHPRD